MLNGIAPLYVIFLAAGTIIDWNAKILPTYRNLYFENLCARTRAVEELKIWKREVKNKQTKNQESIRHFAHLNVLSSLEFISNEYFFSGSIFPGSFLLTASTKCLHMHFSSLQLICPLKDVFPLLCFSWVWFFHMISGWVGDWAASFDGQSFHRGRGCFPEDLRTALQVGVLDPSWEQAAWCQTSSLAKPPCKTSAQLCLLYCLFGFLLLPFFPVSNSGTSFSNYSQHV